MTIRRAILFLPNGKGSPLFFAQWRNKGAAVALQSKAALVDGGIATRYFRDLWRAAFPARTPLPLDKIANRDGTGTDAFWEVFS